MADLLERLQRALASRYRIERELGRGGMATVYLAQDLKHDRPVAIKVLDPEVTAAIGPERFLREVKTVARLTHPHILPLHDSGEADGLLFYVMPYVEGESLRARLEREKQLPVEDALRIAREVAEALSYAHGRGVVHRDIKPENVLLEEGHAVVADFGIARAVMAAGGEKLTATGVALGTPAYMSPEQSTGSRDLDGRSDLYSLGCVLYEMLAGVPPFSGPTAESLVHQHFNVAPRPVTELRPAVPAAVSAALERALAKTAADRFETAGRFGESLGAAIPAPAPESLAGASGPPPRAAEGKPALARPQRALVGAVVLFLLAVGAFTAWKTGVLSGLVGGTPHPIKKDWILVADFEGPPDDSTLAITARDLVSAALDQSAIVATVPPEQIRIALEMAGKPTSTRMDAEVAKQLAYRSAVRAVVEGKIGRLGPGYSVVLRLVDAESLKVILTERAAAKNQDALIPTLGRLAEKLRARLDEKRDAIKATRSPEAVATSSFEAYRLYVQGTRLMRSGSSEKAIPVLREALALDPDFAYAWRRLGVAFGNMDQPDSGLAAFDEALRRPGRLTAIQRLEVEALRASDAGDLRAALAAYDRLLQADSSATLALNRGFVLEGLGRLEEALEWTRMAERTSPFGVPQILWINEARLLRRLGRVDEAREVVRNITGVTGAKARIGLEMTANNWAAVERISDSLLADPGLAEDDRADALRVLALAQYARGGLRAAGATDERAEELSRASAFATADQSRRRQLALAVETGGVIPLPADTWAGDSSTANLLTRGLRAAIAGDRAQAQRHLDAARARWAHSRPELAWQGATPALLEARIAALAGRWDEAARILRPIAAQRVEIGTRVPGRAGMSNVRWFMADAFEKLGQPDSAAVILERVTSDPAPWEPDRGILLAFAHRRLVLLYARMGRLEDARRHWLILAETVRTPDPEIRPLIAEARAALMSAEGMAKSTRR
jgi:tetratricopeptide (TPR) repeat protein